MTPRSGFTLIELVVGLALSLIIILAVYAGIRTSVRSITAVERIALENRMLGYGLQVAVERADSWDDLDVPKGSPTDPDFDPDRRRLRTTSLTPYRVPQETQAHGDLTAPDFLPYSRDGSDWRSIPQPFTPLATSWQQVNPNPVPGSARDYQPAPYDPDGWLPHVPKSWYRGDHAWYGTDAYLDQSMFGNYGLFQVAATKVQSNVARDAGVTTPTPTAITEWRRWLPDQQLGLSYGLGWYGWFDYIPANAMLDIYTVASNGRAVKPTELRNQSQQSREVARVVSGSAPDGDPDTAPSWVTIDGGQHGVFARQRSSRKASLYRTGAGQAVTKGWQTWTIHAGVSAAEPTINRTMAGQYPGTGYYSHGGESLSSLPMLLTTLADERAMVSGAPDDWPLLTVDVRRFHNWGSPRNQCYLRFVDPISGESRELFFPLTATTLRGARLDRGLDRAVGGTP